MNNDQCKAIMTAILCAGMVKGPREIRGDIFPPDKVAAAFKAKQQLEIEEIEEMVVYAVGVVDSICEEFTTMEED